MAWAELSDVRCYYELRGEGEPLLLIPGLGGSCRLWDPVTDALARHFTLILVDNRGMGQSIARRPARNLMHLTADLLELVDYLQLDRTHVLGLSLGGIIAQKFAIDHPSRIDRLVLVSCTDAFSPYLRQMAVLLAHALRRFPAEAFARTIELLGSSPEFLDGHVEQLEEQIRLKCANPVPRRALADQLRCLANTERDPRDPPIGAPTLVLAGEHDALIPNCYGRQMARRIPDAEFEIISGAGHNPFCECPERIVPRIIHFLTRGWTRGAEPAHKPSPRTEERLAETMLAGGEGS